MEYFGYDLINPFRSKVPRGFYHPQKGHTGIDISTPRGTRISLPVPMIVKSIKQQNQMGLTLYLEDEAGRILVFAHLERVEVNVNELVLSGTYFARTGNSGSATTGPHLHFEIISRTPEPGFEMMTRTLGEFSGYNIDPVAYLNALPSQPVVSDFSNFGSSSAPDNSSLPPSEISNDLAQPTRRVHWGSPALDWMMAEGLITKEKDPKGHVTWGQLAVVLQRYAIMNTKFVRTGRRVDTNSNS